MKLKSSTIEKISIRELEKRELVEKYSKPHSKDISPCITISREPCTGGKLIAKLVAKKLKFSYYHKKIIRMVTKHAKKRKELIGSLDEESRSLLEETVGSLFGGKPISSATYFRNLVKVILALSGKGKCLILGRGSNFIVSPESSLRVRIIAPLKTRIINTMKYERKTEEQARKYIRRIHFNRKNFVKKYFGKNISSANYYDLVIKTQNLSVKQAAGIIIKTFKKRFPSV